MKKKNIDFFLLFILCLLAIEIQAQEKWSLKQCIDYAFEHNISIRQQQNRIKKLKIENNTLRNSYLPDIKAGTSQKLDFGRSLNRSNTYGDNNTQNSSFSMSAEMILFSGFKRVASIKKNRFDLLAAEANKRLIENNLELDVTTCYFQILLNREIYYIAQKQIQLTKEQQIRTELLIENGKAPQSQFYDIKAQLSNDELAAIEAGNILRLSVLELAQLLELDRREGFEVDSLDAEVCQIDTLHPEQIYVAALKCMTQIKQAYYSLQGSLKEIKIARSGYYPALLMGAGISSSYYHITNGENTSFGQQFRNNMQKSIYFTLSIPIFDRMAARNNVQSVRVEINNAKLTLENEQKRLYKDIEKAYMDVVNAYEKYNSTLKSVKANEEAHRYALEKYAAGKSAVYEYNEIKMKLADALSQQAQAKYTYLLKEKILQFYSCTPLTGG